MKILEQIRRKFFKTEILDESSQLEPEVEALTKVNRSLRKLMLLGDETRSSISRMDARLESISQLMLQNQMNSSAGGQEEVVLMESDIIDILDELHKLIQLKDQDSTEYKVLGGIGDFLLDRAGLTPIADEKKPYSALDCVVEATSLDTDLPQGCITKILKQGYLREDGTKVRDAAVIVAGARSEGEYNA